jgi:competence protein ComEA
MNSRKIGLFVILLLIIIIIGGAVTIRIRYNREAPVELTLHPQVTQTGTIYIGGAVNNPGFFPLRPGDTVQSLIQAAGGSSAAANLSGMELYVTGSNVTSQAQKVDINTADSWLIEALPGIGQTLARHIIEYRRQNGPFNNINELLNVPGIGATTFDRIKDLITVNN